VYALVADPLLQADIGRGIAQDTVQVVIGVGNNKNFTFYKLKLKKYIL
jgi:hypothetical protein